VRLSAPSSRELEEFVYFAYIKRIAKRQDFNMSKQRTENEPGSSFLGETEDERLVDLFSYLDNRVPAPYRSAVLTYLLPRALPMPAVRKLQSPPPRPGRPAAAQRLAAEAQSGERLEIDPYAVILSRRGETLLKAMAVLHFAATTLSIRWMTPTEIARLIGELDDTHGVYRSNLSNALRKEQDFVSRRPRGRGYEYGLTARGRAQVARELRLLGWAGRDERE
jgi:hypothetical protein